MDIGMTARSSPGNTLSPPVFWDFEDGKLPTGARPTSYPGEALWAMPEVDTTCAYKGRHSLHCGNLQQKKNCLFAFDLPANWGPVLWGRAYIRVSPSAPLTVPTDPSSHGAIVKAYYDDEKYWYELGFDEGKYIQMQHIPEPPGFPEWQMYTNQVATPNVWDCVEWCFDGTQAAEPVLFVNGAEVSVTRRTLWGWPEGYSPDKPAGKYKSAQNFKEIWFGLQMWHPWANCDDIWFDEVAFSTRRVGPL